MIRRAVLIVVVLSTILIAAVIPAMAKMPPFELDVAVDDGVALLSVRVLGIQGLSLPPEGFDPADLDGLLAVYPTGDLDDRGRPTDHNNTLPVDLEWTGQPGLYEGQVVIDPGSWAVVPFPTVTAFDPDKAVFDHYPATFVFNVPTEDSPMLAIGGAILILLTVAIATVLRRMRAGSRLEGTVSDPASASK